MRARRKYRGRLSNWSTGAQMRSCHVDQQPPRVAANIGANDNELAAAFDRCGGCNQIARLFVTRQDRMKINGERETRPVFTNAVQVADGT